MVLPITSGSVVVSPKPGWNPSRVKFAQKRASGQVTRKSATSASPSPPPTAAPWIAPTIGFSEPEQTDRLYIKVSDRLRLLAGPLPRAVERAAVAEIRARAERLALRCQHDGAAAGVLVERLERVGDLADQRDVEEIVAAAAGSRSGDEARCLDADVLERTHLTFLSLYLTRAYARSRAAR